MNELSKRYRKANENRKKAQKKRKQTTTKNTRNSLVLD